MALRKPQYVVPRANVWNAEAEAKRKGVVPLMIPAAPPVRKPMLPVESS